MTLDEALLWLVSASGLGAVAYIVMHWLELNWPWFTMLRSDMKRLVTIGMGGVIGVIVGWLATVLLILLSAAQPPGGWQEWARLLWTFGWAAAVGAQGVHSRELVPRE